MNIVLDGNDFRNLARRKVVVKQGFTIVLSEDVSFHIMIDAIKDAMDEKDETKKGTDPDPTVS
jgi:hypothetical protein